MNYFEESDIDFETFLDHIVCNVYLNTHFTNRWLELKWNDKFEEKKKYFGRIIFRYKKRKKGTSNLDTSYLER